MRKEHNPSNAPVVMLGFLLRRESGVILEINLIRER
jgi:hypothetical protein